MQNGKIKVLTEGQNILEVIKKVKTFEGVVDVTLENGVITYYLDEWASDYDVMISIMNALEEVGVDSETCFDGEEETNEVHHDHDHEHDHEHDHDGEHCCCHDHEHDDDDDHCCCHDHDHDDDECESCGGHIHIDEHSSEGGCC
ncbi:MAG: hypothetical protein J6R88_01385, partial [Clostridia bacterium]|nr:hypothetical protein [Clostridia bacterium]